MYSVRSVAEKISSKNRKRVASGNDVRRRHCSGVSVILTQQSINQSIKLLTAKCPGGEVTSVYSAELQTTGR